MPWWTGGTMLEHLETVPAGGSAGAEMRAFRMPVQLVLRPGLGYRGFAGQIVSGTIRTGDDIVTLPSGRRTRVIGVDVAGKDVGIAAAPMSVALRLADDIDVSRGDMFARPDEEPAVATDLLADLVWMSERALDPDRTYLLKHTTRTVRAAIEVLQGADPETLGATAPHPLALNDIGRVRVRCRAPIFFDAYRDNRGTGAFILVDSVTNDTVGAGMIAGVPETTRAATGSGARAQVSEQERRARLGQAGAVVLLRAPTQAAASDFAFSLERELFDRGLVATVVLQETVAREAADACAAAGLVALVPLAFVEHERASGLVAEVRGERLIGDARDPDGLARRVADALRANSP